MKTTKLISPFIVLSILCAVSSLRAATIAWTNNAANGNFTDATQWLGGVVPTSTDFTLFTNNAVSAYTVSFTADQTVVGTTVRTDRVTFDLNGFTFTNYISRIAPTAGQVATVTYTNSSATLSVVRMTNDTIVGGGGSGTLVFSGDNIRLNYKNVSTGVRNLVGSGGTLKILDGATVDTTDGLGVGSPSIEGGGMVIVDGVGSTFIVRNSTVGNGAGLSTIVIANGATQLFNGSINLGAAAGNSTRLAISNNAAFNGIPSGGDVAVATVAGGISTVDVRNASSFRAVNMSLGGTSSGAGGTAVVTIGNGSTLQSTGQFRIWSAATLNLTGTVVSLAGLSSSGTIFTNYGTLNMNNATATFGATVGTFNGGTLSLNDNATATFSTKLVNTGAIRVVSFSQVTASSLFTNSGSIAINSGGVLEANTLVNNVGGLGMITNSSGVFQFTANPNWTVNAAGTVVLTNGTISYRASTVGDVTNNLGNGALRGITFLGDNTFQLNAASNVTAGQTYTFDTGQPNGSSNYVNLALINGQTAYRGGDVTIGGNGSLLISNTTATITGLFTNNGSANIISSSATFSNGIANAGILTLRSGTVQGAVQNLVGGTLAGNGTFSSNVVSPGTVSPGLFIGTLSFSTNLTLAGTTLMEINSDLSTNDLLQVAGLLTFGGTLTVADLGAGLNLTNGASFQLFTFGSQSGDFAFTNLPGLSPGLGWNTAQLDSQGLISIIVVPEPSTLALVGAGLGLFIMLQSRRQRH